MKKFPTPADVEIIDFEFEAIKTQLAERITSNRCFEFHPTAAMQRRKVDDENLLDAHGWQMIERLWGSTLSWTIKPK